MSNKTTIKFNNKTTQINNKFEAERVPKKKRENQKKIFRENKICPQAGARSVRRQASRLLRSQTEVATGRELLAELVRHLVVQKWRQQVAKMQKRARNWKISKFFRIIST